MKQNDWIDEIDWTERDAEIARKLGVVRWRVGQLRIEFTGQSVKGQRFDPPENFEPERSAEKTAKKYGVPYHVAQWWHRVTKRGKWSHFPENFIPVMQINAAATARKYGVTPSTAGKWIATFKANQAK